MGWGPGKTVNEGFEGRHLGPGRRRKDANLVFEEKPTFEGNLAKDSSSQCPYIEITGMFLGRHWLITAANKRERKGKWIAAVGQLQGEGYYM